MASTLGERAFCALFLVFLDWVLAFALVCDNNEIESFDVNSRGATCINHGLCCNVQHQSKSPFLAFLVYDHMDLQRACIAWMFDITGHETLTMWSTGNRCGINSKPQTKPSHRWNTITMFSDPKIDAMTPILFSFF